MMRTWKILSVLVVFGSLCVPTVFSEPLKHEIKDGQTLYSIARQYGITLDALSQANAIKDPSRVKKGQVLVIPEKSSAVTTVKTQEPVKKEILPGDTGNKKQVVIKGGDTLYGLAREYSTTVDVLRSINGLAKDVVLKTGQSISVPLPAVARHEAIVPKVSETTVVQQVEKAETGTSLEQEKIRDTKGQSWPVRGEIFSMSGKFPGVAIKAAKGDLSSAVSDGKIVYTGLHDNLGNIVFVQGDNGYTYVYGGNESIAVETGNNVRKGDEIGRIGLAPGFEQPQAYFSVWKDGSYIDPIQAPR